MEGRRRFAEAHEPRRADAPRVRADENTRAWRWRTRVPGAEEERASERAFCCTRQLATARRALALAATVASPWSTPVSLLFLLLLLGFSTLYPPLPLSLTRCSRACLRKKKKKKQATLEFKGRRSSWPGSYWSRQYSSNEVSRSIGNWCCNRCNLPVLRFIRLPFCPVGLSRREAALFATLGTLLLLR